SVRASHPTRSPRRPRRVSRRGRRFFDGMRGYRGFTGRRGRIGGEVAGPSLFDWTSGVFEGMLKRSLRVGGPAQAIRLIHPARGYPMKKLFFAALLALPLFAVSARADGCGCWFPQRVDARVDFHFKVTGPGDYSVGQLGPWYLYWPLE